VRVEDRQARRPDRLAEVGHRRHDGVGDALAERQALEGGDRAAGALRDDRDHARRGGEGEQRELLGGEPGERHAAALSAPFRAGERAPPSGQRSSRSSRIGRVTSIGLAIRPAASSAVTAA